MNLIPIAIAVLMLAPFHAQSTELPIRIFAAQNFYGEVATEIGGDRVAVEIAHTPAGADPHDFEPPPSVARLVADAQIVIFNGAGYDHWMERLLESAERADRIEAAELIGVKEGDNPHVWYDPRTMPAVAGALTEALIAADPQGAGGYKERRHAFVDKLKAVDEKLTAIRQRFAGTLITATEPVLGHMAEALSLEMSNVEFQTAVMNESEPSAKEIAGVIDDLKSHRVKVLIYNEQVSDPLTQQILAVAEEAGVPVVGVTETVPDGVGYADWMLGQLNALEKALAGSSS